MNRGRKRIRKNACLYVTQAAVGERLAAKIRLAVATFLFASFAIVQFFLFAAPAHAQSGPAFPSCTSDVYLGQNIPTQLFRVDTTTNPFTYPSIGPAFSGPYNAIGFNPADNYIYAVDRPSGSNIRLLRINSNGGVQVVGTITGGDINVPSGYPVAGEIGSDGFYYLKYQFEAAIYRVDLSTRVATRINMSQLRNSVDLAWYNGLLYSHDGGSGVLYAINPSNGQVQVIGPVGVSGAQFGAFVSASNGVFGINNNGGFYQFNLQTGNATLISSSPTTTNNDGAKCYSTPLQFGADLSITKTDNTDFYTAGTSTTYSIVVSNSGPFGVQGAIVDDPLPTGTTSASWTCGSATGGGTCGQANGSGAIAGQTVDLPVGASVTFTMSLPIPGSYSGDLTNTATVTPPDTALDSDLTNNSATDVDAGVSVAKSLSAESGVIADHAEPGEQLTYQITLTNTGSVAVSGYDLIDTLDTNTSFVSATGGGTLNGGNVEWTNLSIPAGGSLVLTIVAEVDDPLPSGVTELSNIARDPDGPVPACPSAQCVVTPVATAVTYSKSTNATNAAVGDVISYTLTAEVFHSPTTEVLTLTDTLGSGLDFTAITNTGAFTCNSTNPLTCTLPAGTSVGTYNLTYTATVNASATGSVTNAVIGTGGDNPSCSGDCDTDTPVVAPDVTFAKTADTAGPVSTDDIITFTLTTTITNSLITSDVVLLTDTLGSGLDFVAVTSPGPYGVNTSGDPVIEFTLPAGTGPGTYAVSYTARVVPDATGSVSNIVVGSGNDNPTCTTACGTDTPVEDTSVTYVKSVAAPGATVAVGDTLNYTLSATVANSSTTSIVTLTDTLGTGLDFTAITSTGAFTCNAGNPFSCTLPAETPVGTYDLTYTATVNDSAASSVTNAVLGSGPDDPTCGGTCDTNTDVTSPAIAYEKSTSAARVNVGDTIGYTLTATVTNSQTTDIFTLTDTLGTGLDFDTMTDAGAFSCTPGNPLVCTLPAGTPVGTYSLSYNAVVNTAATGSVTNAVLGSGGDNPTCVGDCDTDTPVNAPAVTYAKFADTAGPVSAGDIITFTLSTTVANSQTTSDVVLLTDTLGGGLDFTAVTNAGAYSVDESGAPIVRFSLPAGTGPGTYDVVYTATVNEQASESVSNVVVGSGGDNPSCSTDCGTETQVDNPVVTYAKSTNAANARVGDIISYTLTATVTNAATSSELTLTDTLGTGLDFTAVTSAGAFTCNAVNPLICTLPTGTAVGTYDLTYTATVNASATGSVTNGVTGTGDDNPTCSGDCDTDTPIVAPDVIYAKTADTAGPVSTGDIITFTLTTTIANSKTTSDVVLLTDTLGTGLDFTAVTSAGAYSVDASGAPVVRFTLPAGTGPGTYEVIYTATVNEQATGSVSNAVVGSGGDNPTCTTNCGTETQVEDATVTYAKSVTAPSATVKAGDVLSYALTVTVANSPTTDVLTLTDTLGDGLDFNAVTDTGIFTCNAAAPLVCTLPAETPVGTYDLTYTATVNDSATGSVTNAVLGSGGDDPACAGSCITDTPVAESLVTYAKSANAAQVKVGDTINYTLTATVTNSATTGILTLTDTLGAGLDFAGVTDAGVFTCAVGEPLVCNLPAGTPVGTYLIAYTATVNASAGSSVTNAVLGSGDDNPSCTGNCETNTPLVAPEVNFAKTADTVGPVQAGDIITFTLTTTIINSKTTSDVVLLTDTLGTGLDFTAVTDLGVYSVDASGAPVVRFTLPAGTGPGTYTVSYSATVNEQASGSVSNVVVGSGGDNPTCTTACGTDTAVDEPSVTYAKRANATQAKVGDTISYILDVTISNAPTTNILTLTDTLGSGLDFGAVTDAGAFTCNSGDPLVCTLPTGTLAGTYSLTYTATVNVSASGSVTNAARATGGDNPSCVGSCETNTPLVAPEVSFSKTASTAGLVKTGDTITYTLSTTIANSKTTADVVLLTDTLGSGLDFVAVTNAGAYSVDASGAPIVRFSLPAGTGPGTYDVIYTATVNEQATGSVSNIVVGSGGDNPTCTTNCGTETQVEGAAVTYAKSASALADAVKVGDTISYTLTVTVTNSPTTDILTLTDTLGTGLDFGAVTDAGAFTCNAAAPLVCTLPSGTPVGSYNLTYSASVNTSATGSVTNAVLATGEDAPTCVSQCETSTPVENPTVTYAKSVSSPADTVNAGDILSYTLTATVTDAATTDVLILTDTLGAGLDFTSIIDAGAFTCDESGPLVCTLPNGTAPGSYAMTYTATVNVTAVGTVTNNVVGSGPDEPGCAATCTTSTPVATPIISVIKSADPAVGETVQTGQTLNYSLAVTVANGATTEPLVLVDTPGPGLTVTSLPAGCEITGETITCTLPSGTPVGTHELIYSATVNDSAGETVRNMVTATGGGGTPEPICEACTIEHKVDLPLIRLVKATAVREVRIGDMVRYTLSVENVGTRDLIAGSIVEIPPAGFTYVEDSLQVADGDGTANVSGQSPLRFEGIDVNAGETATLAYLMRVGAGVRPGTHVNQAQVQALDGLPVSNPATAQVELVGDPLIDDSLIFGTVFDDRDGDGWQDSAALSGLHVQGGFAPEAYISGSTEVDHGAGMQPEPDASAPLLHGIRLGRLSARQSEGDPARNHRIVIRQRLNALSFTDDFVLTNAQGVTVRMDVAGQISVEKSGDAAKGLNGAEPRIERRVAQSEGGYTVDYIVENAGIDERGIPGVRVASVEGLIMETDQFGRYHLVGIEGGQWQRGRNFILKVDPATLPEGAAFTTDNPQLRRITPGIPVRFDWGVKLPVTQIEGGTEEIELEMGRIIFAPGSSEVSEQYLPVIEKMAAKIRDHQGGEVVIDATADEEALSYERANAVRTALLSQIEPEAARNLKVVARGEVTDPSSMIVGVDEGGALLGTILFDTDKAEIRPQFEPLLDRIAQWIIKHGGGTIAIIGHTDVRGSFDYNSALGMRRARVIYEALASRVPQDIRAKIRVESSDDPTVPVNEQQK